MPKAISPEGLKALMESGAAHAVLDAREPMEFSEKQIFWTTNAPRASLEFLASRLVPVRATPVVCVDEGGARAGRAAALLEEGGYADVSVLEGGLAAWEARGLPVVSGTNLPSKDFGERIHVEHSVPEIEARELRALIESGAAPRVFDARTEAEFERFSIPTGRSLPGGELILHAWDLGRDEETPLVINCAGRTRSIIGTRALHRLGVTRARALKNGGMGFMLEGLPLDEGRPAQIPVPSEESRAHAEALAERLAREEGVPFVSAEELRALRERADEETLYLLDARLAPEFEAGRVPGAISIPGGQAVQRTDEVVAVRAAKVVVYCDKNARGVMAAWWLRQMGLDARALRGGFAAWLAAGGESARGGGAASGESPAGEEDEVLGLEEARREAPAASPGEARAFDLILDVDSSLSWERGRPAGAKRVSRGWLEDRAPALIGGKDARALLVCEDGRKSALSAAALRRMGYSGAARLAGGKRAWRAAGLPVETGRGGLEENPKDVQLKPYDIGRGAMERYLAWEENLGRKYARG